MGISGSKEEDVSKYQEEEVESSTCCIQNNSSSHDTKESKYEIAAVRKLKDEIRKLRDKKEHLEILKVELYNEYEFRLIQLANVRADWPNRKLFYEQNIRNLKRQIYRINDMHLANIRLIEEYLVSVDRIGYFYYKKLSEKTNNSGGSTEYKSRERKNGSESKKFERRSNLNDNQNDTAENKEKDNIDTKHILETKYKNFRSSKRDHHHHHRSRRRHRHSLNTDLCTSSKKKRRVVSSTNSS